MSKWDIQSDCRLLMAIGVVLFVSGAGAGVAVSSALSQDHAVDSSQQPWREHPTPRVVQDLRERKDPVEQLKRRAKVRGAIDPVGQLRFLSQELSDVADYLELDEALRRDLLARVPAQSLQLDPYRDDPVRDQLSIQKAGWMREVASQRPSAPPEPDVIPAGRLRSFSETLDGLSMVSGDASQPN